MARLLLPAEVPALIMRPEGTVTRLPLPKLVITLMVLVHPEEAMEMAIEPVVVLALMKPPLQPMLLLAQLLAG